MAEMTSTGHLNYGKRHGSIDIISASVFHNNCSVLQPVVLEIESFVDVNCGYSTFDS